MRDALSGCDFRKRDKDRLCRTGTLVLRVAPLMSEDRRMIANLNFLTVNLRHRHHPSLTVRSD